MQLFTYLFYVLSLIFPQYIDIAKTLHIYIHISTCSFKGENARVTERIKLIYDTSARTSGDVESERRVFSGLTRVPLVRTRGRIDEWSETRAR